MTNEMELVVDAGGGVRCIYDEALDLRELGKLQITRASHVEPDTEGYWWADMGPVDGPVLGPYGSRSEALGAERGWLMRKNAKSRGRSLTLIQGLHNLSQIGEGMSPTPQPSGVKTKMIRSNLWSVLFAAFACMLASGTAHADKISTQDFYELPNGAKMSQVIAAVGQPNQKETPPEHLKLITWYYDNVTWHVNGKPCEVRVFFNKHTERLDAIRLPDGVIDKR